MLRLVTRKGSSILRVGRTVRIAVTPLTELRLYVDKQETIRLGATSSSWGAAKAYGSAVSNPYSYRTANTGKGLVRVRFGKTRS